MLQQGGMSRHAFQQPGSQGLENVAHLLAVQEVLHDKALLH